MTRWIALLIALACALPLHAQEFQKCRGEGGATAYRSKGCLSGETLVAVLEPVAEPVPLQRSVDGEAPARATQSMRNSGRAQARRTGARGGKPRRTRVARSRGNPCRRAKQARDDFQRRRGIKVTMNDLSRWNHRVYDACK